MILTFQFLSQMKTILKKILKVPLLSHLFSLNHLSLVVFFLIDDNSQFPYQYLFLQSECPLHFLSFFQLYSKMPINI